MSSSGTCARARGWEFLAFSNGDLGKFQFCDVCCVMEKKCEAFFGEMSLNFAE